MVVKKGVIITINTNKHIGTVGDDSELDSAHVEAAYGAIVFIELNFDVWALFVMRGGYDYFKADENGNLDQAAIESAMTSGDVHDEFDNSIMLIKRVLDVLRDGYTPYNREVFGAKKAYTVILNDLTVLAGANPDAFTGSSYDDAKIKKAIREANICLDALRKVTPVLTAIWQLCYVK